MGTLVGSAAPEFEAKAINANDEIVTVKLADYIGRCYVVLFFYPLDFTFVCPTELIAIDHRISQFEKLNVKVFGVSVDSHHAHMAWRNKPVKEGGIGKINFTLISDIQRSVARQYGVLLNESIALRGTFLIDKAGIVRHMEAGDPALGRNIDELIRVIKAWQYHEENGEVCQAGWQEGNEGIDATSDGIKDFLNSHESEL